MGTGQVDRIAQLGPDLTRNTFAIEAECMPGEHTPIGPTEQAGTAARCKARDQRPPCAIDPQTAERLGVPGAGAREHRNGATSGPGGRQHG